MEMLPLPPFEVWARDFHRSRREYAAVPGPPLAPESPDGEPVTVDIRAIKRAQEEWVAALALRTWGGYWLGHIRFHSPVSPQVVTTGEIFREPSPVEVRRRFRDFDDRAMKAFLNSALP